VKGKVYLVGAGPGDPDLLTLKALRLLQSADVVLHDDLVSPAILKLASPAAQVHNVGKRSRTKKITQEGINFLMTSMADLGLAVLRLKGGDPLIFGRAGEEVEALRRANIEYEIVPGVTAAFGAAAAAGIPLTHRHASHAVTFLTGQMAAGSEEGDWRSFATSGATLVIYMPHELGKIAAKLKQAGLDDERPCALVSSATSADQQVQITTLGDLRRAPRLSTPSLLIVGEVVRFAPSDFAPIVEVAWNQFTTASMSPTLAKAGVPR
jgi:uroporphyrin-III C-methyltransferase